MVKQVKLQDMKNIIKSLALLALIVGAVFIAKPVSANPPDPPAHHGEATNQDPRGAPIDGGLGILLALGAGYGGLKLYRARKKATEEEEEGLEG